MDYASEIKNRISMPEMMLHYGFDVDRAGFCCCPLHGEKTGSFKAYPGNRGFACFGCGSHGSVIDFVIQYFGLTFGDALEKINTDFSLGLPIGQRMTLRQRGQLFEAEQKRKAALEKWKADQDALTKAYDSAFSEWVYLDRNLRKYKPKSEADQFHPLFVEALLKIHGAENAVRIAEMRLADNENRRPNYSNI